MNVHENRSRFSLLTSRFVFKFGFFVLGSLFVAAACSRQQPGEPGAAEPWIVTEDGAGSLRIGDSRADLVTQGGVVLGGGSGCEYVRPANAPSGVAAMIVDGAVRRIDVVEPGVTTASGIGVGSTDAELRLAYPWINPGLPHKYVAGGHYFAVDVLDSPGGPRRFVFETGGDGRVMRYRVGAVPQVDWVEGCG